MFLQTSDVFLKHVSYQTSAAGGDGVVLINLIRPNQNVFTN